MQMVAIGNIAMDTAEKPSEGGLLLFQVQDYFICNC